MPDFKSDLWDFVEALFDKYIPPTFEFISPALQTDLNSRVAETEPSSVISIAGGKKLLVEAQDMKLTAVHLINTCCALFQVWRVWQIYVDLLTIMTLTNFSDHNARM